MQHWVDVGYNVGLQNTICLDYFKLGHKCYLFTLTCIVDSIIAYFTHIQSILHVRELTL